MNPIYKVCKFLVDKVFSFNNMIILLISTLPRLDFFFFLVFSIIIVHVGCTPIAHLLHTYQGLIYCLVGHRLCRLYIHYM